MKETTKFYYRIVCNVFVTVVLIGLLFFSIRVTVNPIVLNADYLISEDIVIARTNEERAKVNLPPLRLNKKLAESARVKACDMVDKDYWAHSAPDGITPWDLIQDQNYCYIVAGENLAKNFNDENKIVAAFMASPKHKDNIVNKNFEEIGVGRCGKFVVFHYSKGCNNG